MDTDASSSRDRLDDPFRVAIVGSGPAGFYAAEALLRAGVAVAIDMFEQLPVPFGLVRFGVAPDHPRLKQVTTVFDRIARSAGFRFVGGVCIGRDVDADELRQHYHAVVLATGASVGRMLGLPGAHLPGSHSAGDVVAWYNGHPDFRDRVFDLSQPVAVIIGHGNVALDIARMLAKTADQLRHTDIAAHALAQLADSRIRDIHIIGRRGPAEARFSVKELREFAALEDCDVVVETQGLPFAASLALHDHPPDARANLALFDELSRRRRSRTRRCAFHFHLEPIAIRGDCRIERVDFARTVDAGTREPIAIDCGLAIQSIGRSTDRLEGVPYDERCGIYANVDGRVGDGGAAIPGLYVCGWSKRGPSGTIGTNRGCSVATVAAILADLDQLRSRAVSAAEALLQRIAARHGGPIDYAGWLRIDAAELARGAADGKPREKLTSIPEMLAIGRRL